MMDCKAIEDRLNTPCCALLHTFTKPVLTQAPQTVKVALTYIAFSVDSEEDHRIFGLHLGQGLKVVVCFEIKRSVFFFIYLFL